jgi:hypothetical protein
MISDRRIRPYQGLRTFANARSRRRAWLFNAFLRAFWGKERRIEKLMFPENVLLGRLSQERRD